MQTWEYLFVDSWAKGVSINGGNAVSTLGPDWRWGGGWAGIYALLNHLGSEGWEMVSFVKAADGTTVVFKRPA